VRVRIGRFRGLRKAIEQPRKTKRVEVGERKRDSEGRTVRHTSGTVRTTRCRGGKVPADASVTKLLEPGRATLPLLPDHGPQTMAYPSIQLLQQ
jgi:hypothetical protein